METEHVLRKHLDRCERDMLHLSATISERESTVATLEAELKHAHIMQSAHRKVIRQLQGSLAQNGIPNKSTMMSISNCRATDDEICPLSLAPINKSPLPFSDEEQPCTLVLNAMKPWHKCAQLACGHRFNSLWLIYHFVERSTFRCPMCRAGMEDFRFKRRELPPGVLLMLERIEAIKRHKS
jgi:hypothetical protein